MKLAETIQFATRIISASSREKPADRMIQTTLARERLLPEDRKEISQIVFAYYRWRGWCQSEPALPRQVRLTWDLELRHQTGDPVPEKELREFAIPEWAAGAMSVSIEWLRVLQRRPVLWIRVKREAAESVRQELSPGLQPGPLAGSYRYDGDLDLFHTAGFRAGNFEIQDLSSQGVGWVCKPKAGEGWWDVCAGEGGKLLHLSDLMGNKGLIFATDVAEWRLKNLKRRTARAKAFNYRSRHWDGAKLPFKQKFDGILIDAPCSGIGTWQRNPQARWTTQPSDIEELRVIQESLIRTAATLLKPEGRLIYSVCTLSHSETVGVIQGVLGSGASLIAGPFSDPLGGKEGGEIFWWPQQAGGNGMYVAELRKGGN